MRRILIVITSDPRSSSRPAEAIRIAAGLVPWQKVQLEILLCGPGRGVLEEGGDFRDEVVIERYLSELARGGQRFYVEKPPETSERDLAVTVLNPDQICALAAGCQTVMRF